MNYSVEFIFLASISGPMALHLFALAYHRASGFLDGSMGEESMCNAGDTGDAGLIHGLRRAPGEENGNPIQYSCLRNPLDRGAWWATVQKVTKSWYD